MATITLKGNQINTKGNLPKTATQAPDFKLVKSDLSELNKEALKGKKVVLNIFPSLDTDVCAASVRRFNKEAAGLDNTVVVCVSKDLPFAHSRFCSTEGIDNVLSASDFRDGSFGENYGLTIVDGPLAGLHSRAVVVLDEAGQVIYTEQVPEIVEEPDYEAALNAVK
ncbi:MAG: thiol peroxidase [Bacteroidetes bacterium]|jgi:thiol peroxidase|nr:thiol peroxidase [Bacteroidota bacterium]MBU1579203.1 thiol peroxidase [Bacteroidota bacterium]MBU2465467.1 thiol peroxidase [Bacteroidota bacterium]MBU2557282.1 thiol peroxidase [Bacteroidota bacterium]MDA3942745.1 thiol peroxidase [Bacteroidota bacterium]